MGDLHFVLRHAVTGGVLLAFVLLGIWIVEPESALSWVNSISGGGAVANSSSTLPTALIVSIASAPVIGIVIQAIHIIGSLLYCRLFRTKVGPSVFFDPARTALGRIIKQAYNKTQNVEINNSLGELEQLKLRRKMRRAPNDSLFVWVYYYSAPPHLIDWARRRRSYYYLGVNLAIAAGIGVPSGVILGLQPAISFTTLRMLACAAIATWVICAVWLAARMKQDVDTMELVWACGALNPAFKSAVFKDKDNENKDAPREGASDHAVELAENASKSKGKTSSEIEKDNVPSKPRKDLQS